MGRGPLAAAGTCSDRQCLSRVRILVPSEEGSSDNSKRRIKDVIENLLKPYDLSDVRILANPLRIADGRWSLQFLDDTPWGHDKSRAVRQAKSEGYRVIFLGDGLSDRGAAESADLVFAKSGLARYCAEQQIPHKPFGSFVEVQHELSRSFPDSLPYAL